MTFEENGQHYIRGILSAIATIHNEDTQQYTCDLLQYAIFTDVAQYLPWIDDQMTEECEKHVPCNSKK